MNTETLNVTPLRPMQGCSGTAVLVTFPHGETRRGALRTAGREYVTVWIDSTVFTVHLSRVQRVL